MGIECILIWCDGIEWGYDGIVFTNHDYILGCDWYWGNPNLWPYFVLHTLTGNLWLAVPHFRRTSHINPNQSCRPPRVKVLTHKRRVFRKNSLVQDGKNSQNLLVKSGQLKVSIVMGGTPSYHPCQIGIFHEINQPASLGYLHDDMEPPNWIC